MCTKRTGVSGYTPRVLRRPPGSAAPPAGGTEETPPATPARAPLLRRRWVQRTVLFVAVFAVYFACPNGMRADSIRAVSVADSMVHRHTLQLDHFRGVMPQDGYGIDTVDGHLLPTFPWADSIFAVPVVAAADVLHKVGIGPGADASLSQPDYNDLEWELLTMALVGAATVVVMWEVCTLALARIGDEVRRRRLALLAALVFAFCTSMLSTATRSYWQHGPDMLFLSLTLLLALRARTNPKSVRWMGVTLAAAYAMRPTASVAVALFTLWVVLRHWRQLGWYLGGAAVVALPWLWITHANWHTWLTPYYQPNRIGADPEFWQALAGNMVSPARGLLVFSPVLALAIPGVAIKLRQRRFELLDAALILTVLAHWVAISAFPHWWGGDSYGPRFFSDMTPLLVVLGMPVLEWLGTVSLRTWRVTAAMVACTVAALLSLFTNGQMAVFASAHCWNNVPTDVDTDTSKLWNWGDPQFLRGAVRFLFGPNPRSQEIRRGGAGKYGCPWEPQVTGGPQSPPPAPQPAGG